MDNKISIKQVAQSIKPGSSAIRHLKNSIQEMKN